MASGDHWGTPPAPPGADRGRATRWDFFVSYTGADRAWAEWIAWQLEDAGFAVLVQAWDFVPGSHWTSRMDNGMRGASHTIAVLSEAYLHSVFGKAEWEGAFRQDPEGLARKLIPVRIAECARPGLLGNVVSFDLFGLPAADARTRLLEQIQRALAGRGKPAAEPLFPGAVSPPEQRIPAISPNFPPTTSPVDVSHLPPEAQAEPDAPDRDVQGLGVAESDVYSDPDYAAGLTAFFAEQWSVAAELFTRARRRNPENRRIVSRLAEARRNEQLHLWSETADRAIARGDWVTAVDKLELICTADPEDHSSAVLLAHARQQQDIIDLLAVVRRLHDERQWRPLLAAAERLAALDPSLTDPGGLVSAARDALGEEDLARRYVAGLRHLDNGSWSDAVDVFTRIQADRPHYRDTSMLLAHALDRGAPLSRNRSERRRRAQSDPRRPAPRVLTPPATVLRRRLGIAAARRGASPRSGVRQDASNPPILSASSRETAGIHVNLAGVATWAFRHIRSTAGVVMPLLYMASDSLSRIPVAKAGRLIGAGVALLLLMQGSEPAGSLLDTYAATFVRLPSVLATPPLPQSSTILASDSSVIATLRGSENRIVVPGDQIPKVMREATVAAQDPAFYSRPEADMQDPKSVVRAALRDGQLTSGATAKLTLTQQYVQYVLLQNARTSQEREVAAGDSLDRKI
ncbi:toll/interleukin-1 receptor domain-containing protein, partial [Frankia canadensis]|uniref:toll/interleukin-1 receptor domain-containing protein n=1 Tax=Frankia canadensis TaxID=1836972 RepID=UPI001FAF9B4F